MVKYRIFFAWCMLILLVACSPDGASDPQKLSEKNTKSPLSNPVSTEKIDWTNKSIRFEHINLDQGLSQSVVQAILQDHQGYLWFGTQDGLNRYDGYEFIVYKHNPSDPNSISNSFIQALYEDENGILWIGTFGGGLNRFDPGTEKFTAFYPDDSSDDGAGITTVSVIAGDDYGTLWLGSNGAGLYHFDPLNQKFEVYRQNDSDPNSLNDNDVQTIAIDQNGFVWVGTVSGGLQRFDPARKAFDQYTDLKCIDSIIVDHQNNLWVGSSQGGLIKLDGETLAYKEYLPEPDQLYGLTDNSVQVIFEDHDGMLWIGTASSGLMRYDADQDRFFQYQNIPNNPESLAGNNIQTIFQDAGGVYWIGTMGGQGIEKFDPLRTKFALINKQPDNPETLINNVVWSILQDSESNLWLGTLDGLTRIAKDGKVYNYLNDPEDSNSLAHNSVFSLLEDTQGRVWLGTSSGLSLYDRENDNFSNYSTSTIYRLLEDDYGNIWAATGGEGLEKFDPLAETFKSFYNGPGNERGLSDSTIMSLFKDHEGTLWAGTFSGGVCSFSETNEKYTCFSYNPDNPDGISNGTVLDILEDRNDNLWIATGGGLNLFDRSNGTFTAFHEKDGLPNDLLYSILEDQAGNLWMGTNYGLSRFDPINRIFKNFTSFDGLQSNEFNQGSRYKGVNGEMFFGGINGINRFFPEEIEDNEYIPPVVITQFQLFNEPLQVHEDSILKTGLGFTDTITLNYSDDFFGFEFSSLHFSAPERNQYAYKLEGLEADWNYSENRHYTGYTNVPPGNYIFRVKASNSDGVWNEDGVSLNIVVVPPFWQRWWFRILMALLIAGIIFAVFEIRISMVRKQKATLEIQVMERTRELQQTMVELKKSKEAADSANRAKSTFLANISHELRTPMNAIMGFSQLLLNSADQPKESGISLSREQVENVEIIHKSGEHLLGLINDVLDMSKIEAGRTTINQNNFDLHDLLFSLEDMFRFRAVDKGLTLEVEIDQHLPRFIHSDQGKLRQILMNLLGNAVKFTQEGGVVLEAKTTGEQAAVALGPAKKEFVLEILITDTGPGISSDEWETIFKPFVQASSVQNSEGTGLGLSISRQYAELLGGELTVTSTQQVGSTFRLMLPVEEVSGAAVTMEAPIRKVIGLETDQDDYRVLIVDDKEINRMLLKKLLEPLGFSIREAINGKEAIQIFDSWNPNIILMDMRMPVMDGYEATRRIKATTKGHATVIIAVTASALEEDRDVILSEGCDGYIRKPFREQEIFDAFEKHLGIRFKYRDESGMDAQKESTKKEGELADDLAALSDDQFAALRDAVVIGDIDRINQLIMDFEAVSQELSAKLKELADQYAFTEILDQINKTKRT